MLSVTQLMDEDVRYANEHHSLYYTVITLCAISEVNFDESSLCNDLADNNIDLQHCHIFGALPLPIANDGTIHAHTNDKFKSLMQSQM